MSIMCLSLLATVALNNTYFPMSFFPIPWHDASRIWPCHATVITNALCSSQLIDYDPVVAARSGAAKPDKSAEALMLKIESLNAQLNEQVRYWQINRDKDISRCLQGYRSRSINMCTLMNPIHSLTHYPRIHTEAAGFRAY